MKNALKINTPNISLKRARAFVTENAHDGVTCPCCDKYVKVYGRKLSQEMATFLLDLVIAYSKNSMDWVNTRDFIDSDVKASSDGAYLAHWGLVEKAENKTGLYKPTALGLSFAMGQSSVPARLFLYNNAVVDSDDHLVSIRDAAGDDNASLMNLFKLLKMFSK